MRLITIQKTIQKSSKIAAFGAVAVLFFHLLNPLNLLNPSPAYADPGPNLTVSYLSGTDATGVWADSTPASIGETVEFYMEIHNTNVPSTAENLTVKVNLAANSTAHVSASNHSEVSDSTSVTGLPANALLQYQSGSLKVTADLNGDGVKDYNEYVWPNNNILSTGINLGNLVGSNYVQLSFKANVVAALNPNLTIKFLSANPSRPGDGWSDNTQANPRDSLQFYLEIHNTNVPSVAEDLKVWVDFDNLIAYTSYSPYASSVSDATKVTFSSVAKRTFRSGSLRVTWDQNGDGIKEYQDYAWPGGDSIVGGGIVLGDLWGCNPYVIQLSFWADSTTPPTPTPPSLTINKKVVWSGNEYESIDRATHLFDPDESVVYKIYVKNEGGSEANGVKVTDHLPTYIRTLDGADKKDFNIGKLAAGKEWVGEYTAKVLSSVPQNDRTQENRAAVTSDNAGSDEDTAFVWINGPEILAAAVPAAPSAARELPATGPEIPVVLGLSGLLSAGLYLHRKLL
jgi:uncharacterized repeat protein (TIGR01451 family)